ncbi:hypothetical protein [Aquisphaera insulae]|uniref:hypothetical protein n=1 Tax=Aquisphaera insulae TaxID=2712864 RepID=UPI0013EB5639|nr:hypothetical protein [Aquisphaera insulae]
MGTYCRRRIRERELQEAELRAQGRIRSASPEDRDAIDLDDLYTAWNRATHGVRTRFMATAGLRDSAGQGDN